MLYDLSPTIRPETPGLAGRHPVPVRLTCVARRAGTRSTSRPSPPRPTSARTSTPRSTPSRGARRSPTSARALSSAPAGWCGCRRSPLIEPRHVEGIDLANPRPPALQHRERARPQASRSASRPSRPSSRACSPSAGSLLVGMDTPSVDPFDSKTLDAHHALLRGGVAILEGLVLDGVPEGRLRADRPAAQAGRARRLAGPGGAAHAARAEGATDTAKSSGRDRMARSLRRTSREQQGIRRADWSRRWTSSSRGWARRRRWSPSRRARSTW